MSKKYGNAIVVIPYHRYRYKRDSEYHAKNIPGYLFSNYHIIVFYWQQLFLGVFIGRIGTIRIIEPRSMLLLIHKRNVFEISYITVHIRCKIA